MGVLRVSLQILMIRITRAIDIRKTMNKKSAKIDY